MQSGRIWNAQVAVVIGLNCSYITVISLRHADKKTPKGTLGPQRARELKSSPSSVHALFGGSAPPLPYPALPPLLFVTAADPRLCWGAPEGRWEGGQEVFQDLTPANAATSMHRTLDICGLADVFDISRTVDRRFQLAHAHANFQSTIIFAAK
jgi:hypothetical protein